MVVILNQPPANQGACTPAPAVASASVPLDSSLATFISAVGSQLTQLHQIQGALDSLPYPADPATLVALRSSALACLSMDPRKSVLLLSAAPEAAAVSKEFAIPHSSAASEFRKGWQTAALSERGLLTALAHIEEIMGSWWRGVSSVASPGIDTSPAGAGTAACVEAPLGGFGAPRTTAAYPPQAPVPMDRERHRPHSDHTRRLRSGDRELLDNRPHAAVPFVHRPDAAAAEQVDCSLVPTPYQKRDVAPAAPAVAAGAGELYPPQASSLRAVPPKPTVPAVVPVLPLGAVAASAAQNAAPAPPGVTNAVGSQNCFLNVVVQALWHSASFRAAFASIHQHDHEIRHVGGVEGSVSPVPSPNLPASAKAKADEDVVGACIYCALEVIFTQMEWGESAAVPPDALRTALALLFEPHGEFAKNEMADASEAFEAVVAALHMAVAPSRAGLRSDQSAGESQPAVGLAEASAVLLAAASGRPNTLSKKDAAVLESLSSAVEFMKPSSPLNNLSDSARLTGAAALIAPADSPFDDNCPVHQTFALRLRECVPPCVACRDTIAGTTKPAPTDFWTFVTWIPASELQRCRSSLKAIAHTLQFSPAACPSCGTETTSARWLAPGRLPSVFIFGLQWATLTPPSAEIADVIKGLPRVFNVSDLYRVEYPGANDVAFKRIRGMIAYYGRHYVAFMACNTSDSSYEPLISRVRPNHRFNGPKPKPSDGSAHSTPAWYLLDDTIVREIAPPGLPPDAAWDLVVSYMVKGRQQPLLVLYE